MSVGIRIKQEREKKRITQEELGEMCGTTKQTIFKYENGVVTNIPFDRLERIAECLDVSPVYLMGWDKKSPPSETESGLSEEATEIAKAYEIADPYVQFGVRKLLGLDTQNEELRFAARKSDKSRSSTGPDTDVEI